jgi:hypothetical protein
MVDMRATQQIEHHAQGMLAPSRRKYDYVTQNPLELHSGLWISKRIIKNEA